VDGRKGFCLASVKANPRSLRCIESLIPSLRIAQRSHGGAAASSFSSGSPLHDARSKFGERAGGFACASSDLACAIACGCGLARSSPRPRRGVPHVCFQPQASSAVLRRKSCPFVRAAPGMRGTASALPREGAMSAESLLLVDDDRVVHEALERELAGRVERVLHAYEPEEGLRIAFQERPDIILLDVNLPRMDGLKLCRHLKETPSTRDVPILFLTVDGNVQRLARALEIGATDYIRKPFDPVELRARVAAALRLRRMIDLLTGVKNRAAFDDALAAAAAAFERVAQPAAVLLLDLDHFKDVNDQYGHGVGDELLRRV